MTLSVLDHEQHGRTGSVADSDAPTQPDGADPSADTPPPEGEDTAQNTQDDKPTNWEARYKAAQAEITRQAQARRAAEDQLNELMAASDEDDDEGDEGTEDDDEPAPRQRKQPRESAAAAKWRERYEQEAWARAESIYGPEVLEAYGTTARMLSRAESPADYITALEAYHQARSKGATPTQAADAAQGGEPDQPPPAPRSDPNRSDMAPAPSVDASQYAGGQNGGGKGFFAEALKRLNG